MNITPLTPYRNSMRANAEIAAIECCERAAAVWDNLSRLDTGNTALLVHSDEEAQAADEQRAEHEKRLVAIVQDAFPGVDPKALADRLWGATR